MSGLILGEGFSMKAVCRPTFDRDNSPSAIRQRYGMAIIHAGVKGDAVVMNSLRDIPTLLKELIVMTPRADEHGRVTIENELLEERNRVLAERIKEVEEEMVALRYEARIASFYGNRD